MNQVTRAIEPPLPLARMISDWRTISGELAEPPRRRQPQLSAYFGWAELPRTKWPEQVSAYGVESRPPLRPTGVFLAVVRRRDRHRRAPGGANVDGLQAVAPHPPGQVAHEGARRVANRGGAHRALQHGGEEGAEELVRDGPQLLFALLRFLCRPGRWSTRLKLQRPPEGSAQVDGNVAKIDLAARGVDGALVHFNAPSWGSPSRNVQYHPPVCPKTGSTSPSLTVHLCLHTALLREIGNAPDRFAPSPEASLRQLPAHGGSVGDVPLAAPPAAAASPGPDGG